MPYNPSPRNDPLPLFPPADNVHPAFRTGSQNPGVNDDSDDDFGFDLGGARPPAQMPGHTTTVTNADHPSSDSESSADGSPLIAQLQRHIHSNETDEEFALRLFGVSVS